MPTRQYQHAWSGSLFVPELEPWQEWLEEQRINGNHNAGQLWREMVNAGFTGSETTVRDAV
ncbi:hypothetical protein, partial [Klebsiella pneumoniae]|uniref:hypothetical protein n=1 Tax=Klebsiella pneumoniae TaxID=573 RepID=UPI001F21E6DF